MNFLAQIAKANAEFEAKKKSLDKAAEDARDATASTIMSRDILMQAAKEYERRGHDRDE